MLACKTYVRAGVAASFPCDMAKLVTAQNNLKTENAEAVTGNVPARTSGRTGLCDNIVLLYIFSDYF